MMPARNVTLTALWAGIVSNERDTPTPSGSARSQEALATEAVSQGIPVLDLFGSQVPLVAPSDTQVWALADLIIMVLGILLALIVVLLFFLRRRKEKREEAGDAEWIEEAALATGRGFEAADVAGAAGAASGPLGVTNAPYALGAMGAVSATSAVGAADYALTSAGAPEAELESEISEEEARRREEAAARYRRRRIFMIAASIAAVLNLVIFGLTQDVTCPMVLLDFWTIPMFILLVAEVVLCILSQRYARKKEQPEDTSEDTTGTVIDSEGVTSVNETRHDGFVDGKIPSSA
jgi:membrane protein implicated in regulation of membrane protease activity